MQPELSYNVSANTSSADAFDIVSYEVTVVAADRLSESSVAHNLSWTLADSSFGRRNTNYRVVSVRLESTGAQDTFDVGDATAPLLRLDRIAPGGFVKLLFALQLLQALEVASFFQPVVLVSY